MSKSKVTVKARVRWPQDIPGAPEVDEYGFQFADLLQEIRAARQVVESGRAKAISITVLVEPE